MTDLIATPHRLAGNENPFPPLPGVLDRVVAAASSLNQYPDPTCARLVSALADRLAVDPAHLVVGAGSVGVAQQLVRALAGPGDEVVHAWRSFEAYPEVTELAHATPIPVPLDAEQAHDLDALAAAVTERTRVVFVCNPNNPTGTVVTRAALVRFLDRVPRTVVVVLDEAYLEFVRAEDPVDGVELYRDRPNVCVLRTFSKAYGLAGLRVGYLVAHQPVAAATRAAAVPFRVTDLAQEAAIASLDAGPALTARVEAITAERDRVHTALTDQGWTIPPSQANFVWLDLGPRTAGFAEACAAAALTVKAFPGEGARVSIGTPAANDAFLEVAARHLR
ncbi:histidinol-phosphate transaminase [Actinokineospora pegani]|uniref:histidinol-phosphate transaminase n=1 Tax=Actinokineospora pegani TaxID=2654637 RepID=UPI001F013927|nr:histidinol-phosphate transaminase [Actinokineospora pegani]